MFFYFCATIPYNTLSNNIPLSVLNFFTYSLNKFESIDFRCSSNESSISEKSSNLQERIKK